MISNVNFANIRHLLIYAWEPDFPLYMHHSGFHYGNILSSLFRAERAGGGGAKRRRRRRSVANLKGSEIMLCLGLCGHIFFVFWPRYMIFGVCTGHPLTNFLTKFEAILSRFLTKNRPFLDLMSWPKNQNWCFGQMGQFCFFGQIASSAPSMTFIN